MWYCAHKIFKPECYSMHFNLINMFPNPFFLLCPKQRRPKSLVVELRMKEEERGKTGLCQFIQLFFRQVCLSRDKISKCIWLHTPCPHRYWSWHKRGFWRVTSNQCNIFIIFFIIIINSVNPQMGNKPKIIVGATQQAPAPH